MTLAPFSSLATASASLARLQPTHSSDSYVQSYATNATSVIGQYSNDSMSSSYATSLSLVVLLRDVFGLSTRELVVNAVQLTLFLALVGLLRVTAISRWTTTRLLRPFPHEPIKAYEPLSVVDWIVHYVSVVYNVGVFQALAENEAPNDNDDARKRPSHQRMAYAVGVTGFGQVFGMGLMLSHSLIGTGLSSHQALHNVSCFLMKVSALSLGLLLVLPPLYGISLSTIVAYFVFQGRLTFSTLPGILLCNLGLILVLASRDFTMGFKIGNALLSLTPLVAKGIDATIGGETDRGHSLGALNVAVGTILQRWSLQSEKKASRN